MAKILTSIDEIIAKSKKCIQLYSGGLDSNTFAILAKQKGLLIHCLHINLGPDSCENQYQELADKIGFKYYYQDLTDLFVENFVSKAILANALYKGVFPICSSLSRPLLAEVAVRLAREIGADTIVHNAGYLQNTATRFNNSIRSLAPDLNIGCPFISNKLSREDKLAILEKENIPYINGIYSIDENIWGRVIECGELENPSNIVEEKHFIRTVSSANSKNLNSRLKLHFKSGIPTAINDEALPLSTIIKRLNKASGEYGIGRYNGLEDTVWQIKNHEVRESPAASVIHLAHRTLETAILTQRELRNKHIIDEEWTDLIVNGFWHTQLQNALFEFIKSMNSVTNGYVDLLFSPGQAFPLAVHADCAPHFYNGGKKLQDHFEELNYSAFFEISAFSQRI